MRERKLPPKKTSLKKKSSKIVSQTSVTMMHMVSYNMLNQKIQSLYPKLTPLEKTMRHSMSTVPFEVYVCGMVFLSIISGLVGAVMTFVVTQMVQLESILVSGIFSVLFGFGIMGLTFGILYAIPTFMVKARATKLRDELPHFIGYMSTLASSGQSLENVFKTIARENSNEEIVKDARYITRNIDLFGMDVLNAIRDVISKTPPGAYQELLEGAISTFESGGDMKEYFNATAKVQLEEKKQNTAKSTESLGVVAELYTVLLVVFPLLAIIMLSVMAIMTTNLMGFDLPTLINLITFAVLPLCGVMMLVMMDSMIPKR